MSDTIIRYGDGTTKTFDVPGSLSKTAFVGGVRVRPQSVTFQSITFRVAPGARVPVEIEYSGRVAGREAAENYGVSYNNNASQNVVAMNTALQRSRVVVLETPGQYLFGGPGQGGIICPGDRTIICGSGVELILADQTYMPLISNENAFSPAVFTGATVTWVGGSPTYNCTISRPGIENEFPVGTYVGVLGLAGTSLNNRGYQGVWRVRTVGTDLISIFMPQQPPNGGNSLATATIWRADSGIKIIGGLWDGNKAGQQSGGIQPGEMRSHIQGFRNCQNIVVAETDYRRGHSWSIGTNNVRDVTIRDIDCELLDPSVQTADASAVFQMSGGARNVLATRISASCGDNIVAASLDVIGAPGSATYLNHDPGDTYDITIRDIHARDVNAAPVAFWGNTNFMHHSVVIERVTGKSPQAAVQFSTGYAPTNMLNCNGGSLTIRDISAACGSAPVLIKTDGNWDTIVIDGVRNEAVASSPLVQVERLASLQNIRSLRISNLLQSLPALQNAPPSSFGRSQPVVQITDSNIEDLRIDGLPPVRLAANTSMVAFTGTLGTVARASVTGANGVVNAAGDSFVVTADNSSPTALGRLVIRDSNMTGLTSTGGVFRQSLTGRAGNVLIENSTAPSGESVSVVEAGHANPAVVTIR